MNDFFYYDGTLYRFYRHQDGFRFEEYSRMGYDFSDWDNYRGNGYVAWHAGFSEECPELHQQALDVLSVRRQRRILQRVYGKSRPKNVSNFWLVS